MRMTMKMKAKPKRRYHFQFNYLDLYFPCEVFLLIILFEMVLIIICQMVGTLPQGSGGHKVC